jgi:hypothetical protein
MTVYHVLRDHWEDKEGAFAAVQEDLRTGKMKDWGAFAGRGRGFALVNVESEVELFALASRYLEFGVHILSAEPVLSAAQIGPARGA